jgi:NAD(P)-dependent dehydrogenase (short-subunit alcohol dehydrogenase family)
VAIVGRDKSRLDHVAAELPYAPLVVVADLSEPAAPVVVLDQVLHEFGRLDVLVNNAGASHMGASHELTVEECDAVWALNVRAALMLAGRAAEHMARSGGGSIVSISSSLSRLGNTHCSLYAASKGALDAASRALAAEWGERGVRVNVVRPAVTRSDMAAWIVGDDAARADYEKQVPMGRVGEAEEIAEAVFFLSAPSASYITGQSIDVDGGWGTTKPPIGVAG